MGQALDSMGRRQSKDELLYRAALAGNLDALKALSRDGAHLEWFDQEGKTALIAACLSPDLYEVVRTLIELGANINAYRPGRNGGTPLHHAAKRGSTEIVKLLLSHGANALVMNDDCQTPLDVARKKGFTDVVRLIEHHISYFTGWLREFHGPSFLGALAPQLLSKKIWAVVAPRGPVNHSKPLKLELAIYNTLEDSEPRTVISLWMSQIEKPKFSQHDLVLRILDKSNGNRYKLGPASDGDKQQIQLLYSACLGIRQTAPSTADPFNLSSVNTSQSSAEDAELAMAISASIQTADEGRPPLPSNSNDPSIGSATTNDWENMPNDATYNGWGPSEVSHGPGSSDNGWKDQPVDSSYNGWGTLGTSTNQTLPVPTHGNVSSQPQMNNEIPGFGLVNPTAPPLPVDGFHEGSLSYPSIDVSPVELPNRTNDQEATNVKTENENNGSDCCIICWEAPVQGACVPCGHMAGCMSCLSEIKSKKGDCPVCRTKLSQVIRLYAV